MDYAVLAIGVVWYAAFVVSTTIHEAAHAFAAKKFGDPTAYHHGLVTLDPIPHIQRSPFGMLIIPILSYVLNGWMIGWASAPYDPFWAHNNRKQAALMSLAGPAGNLLLLLAAGITVRIGMLLGYFHPPETITFTGVTAAASSGLANSSAVVISIFFSLNLILLAFNLIPLPPLDGSSVLMLFMQESAAEKYEHFLSQPGISLFGLVIAWNLFDKILPPIHSLALAILYPGLTYQ
jgi:Zn-dependent protease